ncbi:MAG: hypothetical protein ACLTSX_10210 [Collinsella sp.]
MGSHWPTLRPVGRGRGSQRVCFAGLGCECGPLLLVAGVVVGAGLLSTSSTISRKRPFYADLAACTDDLEHPLWIFEMVDEPDYLGGLRLAYEALSAVSKAANDDVSEYRRQAQDYREYVETWVHEAKSPLAAAHLMLENLMEACPPTRRARCCSRRPRRSARSSTSRRGLHRAGAVLRPVRVARPRLPDPPYSLQKARGRCGAAPMRVC